MSLYDMALRTREWFVTAELTRALIMKWGPASLSSVIAGNKGRSEVECVGVLVNRPMDLEASS